MNPIRYGSGFVVLAIVMAGDEQHIRLLMTQALEEPRTAGGTINGDRVI
jgi:hypothetical protein